MQELLTHAGAPQSAIKTVPEIVETCRICRMWTRPTARSMTRTRLATEFNQMVQWDLLFVGDWKLSHCLDEATWSIFPRVESKSPIHNLGSITLRRIRPYSPMKLLTTGREEALNSDEASNWADKWGIEISLRPKYAHADMVERHHDVARQLILRVRAQLEELVSLLTTTFSSLNARWRRTF